VSGLLLWNVGLSNGRNTLSRSNSSNLKSPLTFTNGVKNTRNISTMQ
jgi:hypothetical protein